MADVARAAGVSAATVSRVLAGVDGATSDRTAATVRQTARDLGYVVNAVAASLRSQQTRSVGLVMADVGNPFFGQLASGVENTLSEAGYSVILVNTNNSVEQEQRLIRLLIEKRVDAMIVATSARTGEHIREAIDVGMRVVLVDSELPDLRTDSVTIDNVAAARSAVEHLLDLGHTEIGIITGQLEAAFDLGRLEGYQNALQSRGIRPNPHFCVRGGLTVDGGRHAAAQLLSLAQRPTALFVTNNLMTIGTLVSISETGLSLPQDISIIGFDDMDWYRIAKPGVTAVHQPAYDMGRIAAGRLLDRIAGKSSKSKRQLLNAELIVRESTAAPLRPAAVQKKGRTARGASQRVG